MSNLYPYLSPRVVYDIPDRPVHVDGCAGSPDECFTCPPGAWVYDAGAAYEVSCVRTVSVVTPMAVLGSIVLGAGLWLSRRGHGSLGSLGDDITPPSSFDPSRSNRAAYLRTHVAKKFWGATILTAQAAVSLDKLATRVRSANPDAAGEATALADYAKGIANSMGQAALKYDEPWVRNRMMKSGIAFELEPGKTP